MRAGLVHLFSTGGITVVLVYIPLWGDELGLSKPQIGLVASFYSLMLVTSAVLSGRYSDQRGRRGVLWAGLGCSTFAIGLPILAHDFHTLLMARCLGGLAAGSFPPTLVAYNMDQERRLGQFLSYGGLGFMVGSLLAGVFTQRYGLEALFFLSPSLLLVSFVIALTLPPSPHRPRPPAPTFGLIKHNFPTLYACLIRHSGAAMLWVFWSLFVADLGASLFWVGLLMGINAMMQFLTMVTVTDRIGPPRSIMLGLFFTLLTFVQFLLAPDPYWLIPAMFTLGMAFGFLWVGAFRKVERDNAVDRASASGLLQSSFQLSSFLGPITGTLIVFLGGSIRTIIAIGASMSFLALVTYPLLLRHWERRFKVAGETDGVVAAEPVEGGGSPGPPVLPDLLT